VRSRRQGAEEQEGGEPPPLAGAGVVVCLMGEGRTISIGWDDAMVARWSANLVGMFWPESMHCS
jgi:hypothetical protein